MCLVVGTSEGSDSMTTPINPQEVVLPTDARARHSAHPRFIRALNELIKRNMSVVGDVRIYVKEVNHLISQDAASDLVNPQHDTSRELFYEESLAIVTMYRVAGWNGDYDPPSRANHYHGSFYFRLNRS